MTVEGFVVRGACPGRSPEVVNEELLAVYRRFSRPNSGYLIGKEVVLTPIVIDVDKGHIGGSEVGYTQDIHIIADVYEANTNPPQDRAAKPQDSVG